MPNMTEVLSAVITVTDTTITPNPTIVTRNMNNPSLTVNTVFYDPFILIGTAPVNIFTPAPVVYTVFIRNLHTTNNLLINWTPNGGPGVINVCALGPGGVFLYFPANETAGTPIGGLTNGVTTLTLSANAAATPVEVLVAA